MAKFQMRSTLGPTVETARMGTVENPLTDKDKGKALALKGPSQLGLAGDGDEIIGFLTSIESGTQDGFKIGGFQSDGYAHVDTGDLEVGDEVVVETNPELGVAGLTKVKKAGETGTTFKWVVVHPGVIRKV